MVFWSGLVWHSVVSNSFLSIVTLVKILGEIGGGDEEESERNKERGKNKGKRKGKGRKKKGERKEKEQVGQGSAEVPLYGCEPS